MAASGPRSRGATTSSPAATQDERVPGRFPGTNTGADGIVGTAPVDAFAPNGFGLYNVTGNVWEWCNDWFDLDYYDGQPTQSIPAGPESAALRVQRGGSYLCHLSYCRRYRVSARDGSEPDSSTSNAGFRVASRRREPRRSPRSHHVVAPVMSTGPLKSVIDDGATLGDRRRERFEVTLVLGGVCLGERRSIARSKVSLLPR